MPLGGGEKCIACWGEHPVLPNASGYSRGAAPWRVELWGCRECQGSFGRAGHPGVPPQALAWIREHRDRPVVERLSG